MIIVSVDVEADGPAPGLYSMVSFGAVIVEHGLERTFYGQCKPISDAWIPGALAVSGHSRKECLTFPEPSVTMGLFSEWLNEHKGEGHPQLWADNNGFDFAFINYYFVMCGIENPFGWSSQNLKSFYKGLKQNLRTNPNKLRKTEHTHHPVDDAKGNAEAIIRMSELFDIRGLKFE